MDSLDKRRKFIINVAFFGLIAGMVWFTFHYLIGWLLPFIIGFTLAYLMNPLINWVIKKTPLSRKVLAYLFTLILGTIIGLVLWLLVYLIINLTTIYIHMLPNFFVETIQPVFFKFNSWFNSIVTDLSPSLRAELTGLQTSIIVELQSFAITLSKNGLVLLTNVTRSLPSILISFLFTILATIFSTMDFPLVKKFIFANLPKKYGVLIKNMKVVFIETIGKYIQAYLKIMSITFLELSLGFWILGIPTPFLFGLIISIFDILPVLGTGGILVPWIVVELFMGDFQMAGGLGILYGVVTVVRNLIEPKLVGDHLGLNPLVTLISIYLGFTWFGVFGMLLVPIGTNIFLKLYQQGKLKAFVNLEELYGEDGKYCENDEIEGVK